MRVGLRRVGQDVRHRRNIEIYVVVVVSVVLAVLSLFGDVVDEDLRWAAALAALGLLTYQVTLPARPADLDGVLHSRESFEDTTFGSRVRAATEIWLYGPSAVNLLTAETADQLRRTVLARREGVVRVMVLDPEERDAVALAARQLDEATDFPAVGLHQALAATTERLELMAAWNVPGRFECRLARFNPGFSLVAIDPYGKEGVLIVEFHGAHNESTASRMHVELTRTSSERWYAYWREQFEHLWGQSRRPATGEGATT